MLSEENQGDGPPDKKQVRIDTLMKTQWYRWYALAILVLVYCSSHVDRQIMGILLEPIKLELGASDTQMGFLIGLTFAIFYATLGMPIAMLADRTNRRNIIALATTIWSGMTVLCAFVGSYTQLALARIGVGIGEAGSSPPSHSMISDLFPQSQRATAMGIFALGINLGLLIAYLGGGWMSEHWGWRTTFIVVGLPGILIALLVRFTLIEPPRGASEEAKQDRAGAPGLGEVWKTMLKTPATRHVVFGSALAGFVGYGMTLWLPAFFVRSHGLSQSETGLTLSPVIWRGWWPWYLYRRAFGGLFVPAGPTLAGLGGSDWQGRIGAVLGAFLLAHGLHLGVTGLHHSSLFRRFLLGSNLCHGAAAGACANAFGCRGDLFVLVEHHWHGTRSSGRGYFKRRVCRRARRRVTALFADGV
jgi:MFS family permease